MPALAMIEHPRGERTISPSRSVTAGLLWHPLPTMSNMEIARAYLKAIEDGEAVAALEAYFSPDVVIEYFPNRIAERGSRVGMKEAMAGAERGGKLFSHQRYEIRNWVVSGDTVVLEVDWTGSLAIPFGTLAAGIRMHARFATFLLFRDGKVLAQRNYDCYDPW
jgi:ketosteroid isomerase-like protein